MASKKLKLIPFDMVDFLDSEKAIQIYMNEAAQTNDPAYIAHALGTVARAHGMAKVAKKSGLSRESLYKALNNKGNPEFATIFRVIEALGLKMSFASVSAH